MLNFDGNFFSSMTQTRFSIDLDEQSLNGKREMHLKAGNLKLVVNNPCQDFILKTFTNIL